MYTTLTLDIETAAGRPEDAERDMRINWSPSPNWKPETIGNRYLEMFEKKKDRLALIDGSRVISIALRGVTDLSEIHPGTGKTSETRCLHNLHAHPLRMNGSAGVEGFATEAEMLAALRTLLDATCAPDTTLVGHNIRGFDLPKMRMAYLRHGMNLPRVLAGRQPEYDTMREWGFSFSATKDPFVSVADVLEILGVEHHKHLVDGSQVEQLLADGKHDTIINYNLLDVIAEHDLFERMTGQSADAARTPVLSSTEGTTKYATELPGEVEDPSQWDSPAPQEAPAETVQTN